MERVELLLSKCADVASVNLLSVEFECSRVFKTKNKSNCLIEKYKRGHSHLKDAVACISSRRVCP